MTVFHEWIFLTWTNWKCIGISIDFLSIQTYQIKKTEKKTIFSVTQQKSKFVLNNPCYIILIVIFKYSK